MDHDVKALRAAAARENGKHASDFTSVPARPRRVQPATIARRFEVAEAFTVHHVRHCRDLPRRRSHMDRVTGAVVGGAGQFENDLIRKLGCHRTAEGACAVSTPHCLSQQPTALESGSTISGATTCPTSKAIFPIWCTSRRNTVHAFDVQCIG
jgi:hypothetical protein